MHCVLYVSVHASAIFVTNVVQAVTMLFAHIALKGLHFSASVAKLDRAIRTDRAIPNSRSVRLSSVCLSRLSHSSATPKRFELPRFVSYI